MPVTIMWVNDINFEQGSAMKAAILEKSRPIEKAPEIKPMMKLERPVSSPALKHQHRIIRTKHWEGEFNGLWCDEELY